WGVGDHTIRSITSYRDWNNDTFESALRLPGDLLNRVTAYDTETVSQELQLLSPVGDYLEYVAGLYYYDEKYNIDQQFDLGAAFCPAVRNLVTAGSGNPAFGNAALAQCDAGAKTGAINSLFEQELTSLAAFGQLTLNIDERLRLTGGLRWTRDDKEGSFDQAVPNIILLPPTLNPLGINLRTIDSAPDLAFKETKATWMANVSYDVTDNVMAFASVSTGFKSGGFNSDGANTVIPRVFESETVDNYEMGMKSYLLQNRLLANLSVFRTNIDNFQDRQFDGVNFIVQNVGELTQSGVEMDIQAQPNANLFMVAGASYLDSEFKSFPNATNLPAVVAAAQAAGVTPPPRDLAGERNHFSPKWQLSFMGEWRDRLGTTGMGWFVRGEYQHTSS
ncbi:MAG: TonB-dependent receptor, partial [Gammaproteobacteria bacterium]